jgi:diaminohydroxyphosphoribosylaminopyrimidine deaminase / 5-amino-6-(5-phosphoribosylamino)uracil reductase
MRNRFSDNDLRYMRMALVLADGAKGRTFPNPAVGAVVVKSGRVVGRGATAASGGAHAEKTALAMAGRRARGATLFVTLEPCCHLAKRTAPCTEAVVESGVARVVAAVVDPNPAVAGKGLRRLRRAGIETNVGLLAGEAALLNEDFFWWVTRGRPWVSLKLAMTLDGRIADSAGRSRWVTSRGARQVVHDLRRRHAGIAVGANTVRRDDPSLTVRHVPGVSPVRFIFTTHGRIPAGSVVVRTARQVRTVIVVTSGGRPGRTVRRDGVEVWRTGSTRATGGVVRSFLRMAGREGITSILVEGGARLAASFIEAGAVNRCYFFYGPKVLGAGPCGISLRSGFAIGRCPTLSQVGMRRLGDDVLVTGLLTGARRLCSPA